MVPNQRKQLQERRQTKWLGVAIIQEPFDLLTQNGGPLFVPEKVFHKIGAGLPDAVRVLVNRREDIE